MSEAEYIKRLERDLKAALARAEAAEECLENMRKIACAIAANVNKIQRLAGGEKDV